MASSDRDVAAASSTPSSLVVELAAMPVVLAALVPGRDRRCVVCRSAVTGVAEPWPCRLRDLAEDALAHHCAPSDVERPPSRDQPRGRH